MTRKVDDFSAAHVYSPEEVKHFSAYLSSRVGVWIHMRNSKKPAKIKAPLQLERELRNWTQTDLANHLYNLCLDEETEGIREVNAKMVGVWERGEHVPSLFWRRKLCELFGKDAKVLGFVESQIVPETLPVSSLAKYVSPHSLTEWVTSLPPQPYIAHPYPLQENFTGRLSERELLTEWWLKDQQPILSLVAIGGMGKSALAWTWLQQDILSLPDHQRPEGIIWWSLYEPEAYFSLFLNYALAYASSGEVNPQNISSMYEKTQILINLLQRHKYLFILDGFERELRAYSSLTSFHNNSVDGSTQGNFRICTDPHTSSFLRRLAATSSLSSKILLTSRLFPRELDGLAGCRREELTALKQKDAITFLRAQGVRGTRAEIQTACASYGNHPLTLRLLAGLIAFDPERPGDVTVAPDYSPISDMIQREHHALGFAYEALRPLLQQLLSRLAACRSPVDFDIAQIINTFDSFQELKLALRELIERGFLFFDQVKGRYDLHPVVRRYAYSKLFQKEDTHRLLVDYLQSRSQISLSEYWIDNPRKLQTLATTMSRNFTHIRRLEDLTDNIELYHHLIHAELFQEAFQLYYHSLASLLFHQLGAYQVVIELLQAFFLDDKTLPSLDQQQQSWVLDALASAYSASGYPQRAVQLLELSIHIDRELGDKDSLTTALWNLAVQQLILGELKASEQSLQESISICQDLGDAFNEAKTHQYMALLRAYQGRFEAAFRHLDTAVSLFHERGISPSESVAWAYRALCNLLANNSEEAFSSALHAQKLAEVQNYERDIIRANWLLGVSSIRLAEAKNKKTSEFLRSAEQHLNDALKRCRRINMVDYEADLLLAHAKLHYAKGNKVEARAFALEALAIANRSDFRVLRADIYNLIAKLEQDDGNGKKALKYAQKALGDASCDEPPYCYVSALEEARHLLKVVTSSP